MHFRDTMTLEDYIKLDQKRNRGKSAASEHDLQVSCVNWFRYTHPKYARLLMAIPNGGQRNSIVAAKLKAEGVVSGVPDMFLAIAKHDKHGLWIEMKNGKAGRLSDHQKVMIKKLEEEGYLCIVCHNIDEFVDVIEKYLS